jgi:hypothetical protein
MRENPFMVKGRLQSFLRMSVIVFCLGTPPEIDISVYTRSVSFLAITRALFFFVSEFNSKGVKNFPKFFLSDNLSSNELLRQHDE